MFMQLGGYEVDILVGGYPGKSLRHGGLGWSTVALLRGHGRVAVLDTGSFGLRRYLLQALRDRGVEPGDVTDLVLSHLHYDHVVNWPMFSAARITVGEAELRWALDRPIGDPLVPEFYVRPLADHPRLTTVGEAQEVLPGITAHLAPGHTPGHLMFLLAGAERDLLLVQDAAKYRAELVSGRADMTYDPAVTAATIRRIWEFWRRKPGTVVLPGHDLPMVLEADRPVRMGRQEAGIIALFGEDVADRTLFGLGPAGA
ncbi:MBL fold metallo-hydrolase [Roseomonas elaeocarpi]|uniref:MBL fold metallo-hydrolase n=1 Tax=Roseomonas elaeocarpi TaxID=907779 RepID=A0ABV6JMA3_9PROT